MPFLQTCERCAAPLSSDTGYCEVGGTFWCLAPRCLTAAFAQARAVGYTLYEASLRLGL